MKGVSTTRNGGARAVKGKATRCMYSMSEGKTPFKGTERLSIPTPKGK